ncbi:MAG: DUF3536 domain-containing protein [Candidatus Omnitrophota bacterium]
METARKETILTRYICIHGHFYQPPRENPWLEEIERQDSSAPFHDWNQRITEECYAPNTAARILNENGKITDIVNNYTRMSFNFGPTLLSWMERNKPEVYQHVIESDRESRKRFSGHGSAIAQCYNHVIMPLANSKDKLTQIIWGIRDFEYRFGRAPEGMWLPETAVDIEALEILAVQGIKFTILAPRQARKIRGLGTKEWEDVSGEKIDPRQPYLCPLPSGRQIVIFFYDGPLAKDIAFGNLLADGKTFSDRILSLFTNNGHPELVHVATDGESYGHHHRFGEMALAFCLHDIERHRDVRLTIYSEFLEKFPPRNEVQVFEASSWSCVHGVERWRSNCGCCSGLHPDWNQQWRTPLRQALNWLSDHAARVFEEKGKVLFKDVWEARNNYIDVILNRNTASRESFFKRNAAKDFSASEKVLALHLLEMQRNAMLMFTSCGWFFDEISGIETVQIMMYAVKVMQLIDEVSGVKLLPEFQAFLKNAPSNLKKYENGKAILEELVLPPAVNMKRVVAHYAMSSLFENYKDETDVYCFHVRRLSYDVFNKGEDERLAAGTVIVRSELTCEEQKLSFAVFYFGGHEIYCGVSTKLSEDDFFNAKKQMSRSFLGRRSRSALRIMRKHFEEGPFSLRHLFRDEQAKILYQMLDTSLFEVEKSLREIHDHHYPIMQVIKQLHMPLPKVLSNTVLVMVNTDFLNVLGSDPIDFKRLNDLVAEVVEWNLDVDRVTLEFFVSRRMKTLMEQFAKKPQDYKILRIMNAMLTALEPLRLTFDVGKPQNIFCSVRGQIYEDIKAKALRGHERAKAWVRHFDELAQRLNVDIQKKGAD